jgi:hypothetical protein
MKIDKKLIETLTREAIVESQLDKKTVAKKKKSEVLNESPTMDFINAVKSLDPAALTALGISALPIGAAVKVIADFIKDKRSTKDKLKDINKTIASTR